MAELPKLKIKKHFGSPVEERICDLDQARDFLLSCLPDAHRARVLIAVEGQLINSYDELVQLVNRDCYKDKEFIEIGIYPIVGGG